MSAKKMVLGRAVDLFLGEQKASTRKSYFYNLRDLRLYVGEQRPLDEVSVEDILRFSQHYRGRPSVRSPATYNKCVKTLRTFFNWCIKMGFMDGPSPARYVKRLRHVVAVSRKKAMPDEVYAKLVEFARGDARSYALVLFLGDGGGRIGGAAGLRWEDIDFTNRKAIVTEKGQPPRQVFFREECCFALMRWRHWQKGKGEYVFSASGEAIKSESLGDFFKRLCLAAVGRAWGPHSLRHRKGFQLADNRISPTTGAQLMGHSDVKMLLENYYPKDWERVQQAVEELGYSPEIPRPLPKIINIG